MSTESVQSDQAQAELRQAALEYHEFPVPGKLQIQATKQLVNQRDLALAYSPGVAAPCLEIQKDPQTAFRYTNRGNLIGVISNGTAVLGLGNIGALASKPVMEGKAVLFKKFAGIDVFDIEVDEQNDLDKLVEVIAALEPTFGGINLEDIKAPDCFYVERRLRERMKIPVFHDDQHGTAIVVGAAVLGGLRVVGKELANVKLVTSGAGAAALACLKLLVKMGLPRENIFVTDLAGVVYEGRTELMDEDKIQFAQKTDARKLTEVIDGADVFLGLSARRRAQAGDGQAHGAEPADPGTREPEPRNHARRSESGAARRGARDRPHRLPEPGQQRPVLPLHLPRRARLRCDHDHRRDGNCRGECDRRSRAGRAERGGGGGLCGSATRVRARIPDPEAVRSAADDEHRAGRGPGRGRQRRRTAADCRHGGVSPEAAELRLRLRHHDEADLHDRAARPRKSAWPTARAKKSACCAPARSWSTSDSHAPP